MDWVILVVIILIIVYVLVAKAQRKWVGSDLIVVIAGVTAIIAIVRGMDTGATKWVEDNIEIEGVEDGSSNDVNADVDVARQNQPHWDVIADAISQSVEFDPYGNKPAYMPGYRDAYLYNKDDAPVYADLHRGPTAHALYQWGTDKQDYKTDKWDEFARDPKKIWEDGGERYHNMYYHPNGAPESNLTAHHASYRGELARQNIERSVNTTSGTLGKYFADELNFHESRQWMDDYSDQVYKNDNIY